jgi:cytochrome c oxidase subunit 2
VRRTWSLRRRLAPALGLVVLSLALAGCGSEAEDQWGRLGLPEPITEAGDRIEVLWRGAWIAALIVGVLVWGLIIFASIVHRRRPTDEGLPPQVRYNLPVEIIYTVAPVIVVLVFFFFTARDESKILQVSNQQEHTVSVVGKRWSWDFNYLDEKVFETGTQGQRPTLVLPQGEKVQFVVDSRDVIHSFWIPAFLFKFDAIPGKRNTFEVTPQKTGTFAGKCAELCGTYHARMLFDVRVVDRQEYDRYIESLRAKGQTGELPADKRPGAPAPGRRHVAGG